MVVLSSPVHYIVSTPPVTRAWTAGTVFLSLLYFWIRYGRGGTTPYLTLIPGQSLFYPWTLVTSGLVETTVIELLVTILVIPPSLRYLERLWGAIETAKFIVVTLAISNVIALAFNWIEYIVLRSPTFLFGMEYHGQMALQTGILVAFTQLIPEHQVQVFGILKARVKALPMAYLTFSTVMGLVGFQCPFIIIQFAWLVSWIYLRFYKKNTGDTVDGGPVYGDRSETFAFIQWFPPFVHAPISVLSNTAHHLANRFHLIPGATLDVEAGAYAQLPGGARAEAERRRAMALKALDQRLANSHQAAQPVVPASSSSDAANPQESSENGSIQKV
ncbi:DUF1751-domain-containing protein [Punctularia strigosozonata HHB-11173 SS5]|uniref:DUF1751-domain-containing protein n=1 Tax=Punctularia strigosozonata (strain HHB-11173) TaxID=741275 RepID=UPI0004416BBF|nr:DUF1751-domain-containing protein [Punctularia strigosozonata HHB-11173 SS5]EIN13974.1 DUF1751-domain-containing protein [Punctularia strigosozonata HHB-11173 SS5]